MRRGDDERLVDVEGLLRSIAPGPIATETARDLRRLVESLATMALRARDGRLYRVPHEARDDVVQAVLLKVLERSPLPVVGHGPAACRAYLASMVVHQWLAQQRASRRTVGGDALDEVVAAQDGGVIGSLIEVPELRQLLDRLLAEARRTRAPRYRDELDRVFGQIVALCFEDAPMTEILLGVVAADAGPAERKRAVDRVLKSHQRAREELRAAVDRLLARGELSWVEADRARMACRLLLRCQRRGRAASPEESDG